MLVVKDSKTFVLVHPTRPSKYIFRLRDDGQVYVRFIHPDRRFQFDSVVSIEEARVTGKTITGHGYYLW